MALPNLKKIVSQLTDEVVERLKKEGEFEEQPSPPISHDTGPSYIKLTKVNNGFILDMNNDNDTDQAMTEVIEVDDASDPDAISGILYGVAEWLGIEYIPTSNENLNITFDGVGENFEDGTAPPSPIKQSKINDDNVDEYNKKLITDQNDNPNAFVEQKEPQPEPPKQKKPSEITREDVIRAAMGYDPDGDIIQEEELSPAEKIGVDREDYEVDEDELDSNEWIQGDTSADEYEDLTEEQYKEMEELPDGDYDEDEDYGGTTEDD